MNTLTKLISGGLLAQLINLGSMPFITRLYDDSEVGVLAFVSYFSIVILPLSTLKINEILPTIKSKKERELLIKGVFSISALICSFISLFFLIIFFFKGSVFGINNYFIFPLISVSLLFLTLFTIAIADVIIRENFGELAKVRIYQAFLGNLFKIFSGFLNFGAIGLILGNLIAQSFGISRLSPTISYLPKSYNEILLSMKSLQKRAYVPIRRVPAQFMVSLANYFPIFVIPVLFSSSELGQFSLAFMLLSIPIKIVTDNTSHYFYSRLISNNCERYSSIYSSLLLSLSLIGLLVFIVINIASNFFFIIIFGDGWEMAKILIPILTIMFFFQFMIGFVAPVYNVLNKQSKFLKLSAVRLLLVIISSFISWMLSFDILLFVFSYSLSMVTYYLILLLDSYFTLKLEVRKYV